jgi:hypothetical protein
MGANAIIPNPVILRLSTSVAKGSQLLPLLDLMHTLEAFLFLRWRVAGESVATGVTLGLDAGERFALGAGLAQHDDGTKGFCVDTRYKVGVAGTVFFPKLADLNFGNGHGLNPDFRVRRGRCQLLVTCATLRYGFSLETGAKSALDADII